MKKNKTVNRRIQRGITFLDAQKSGWREEVDPDTLKMSTDDYCILGQVFGSFDSACDSLGLDHDIAAHMGFTRTKRIGWKRLTKQWRKAIKKEALVPA